MNHNVDLTSGVLVRLKSVSALSYLAFSLGNIFAISLDHMGLTPSGKRRKASTGSKV